MAGVVLGSVPDSLYFLISMTLEALLPCLLEALTTLVGSPQCRRGGDIMMRIVMQQLSLQLMQGQAEGLKMREDLQRRSPAGQMQCMCMPLSVQLGQPASREAGPAQAPLGARSRHTHPPPLPLRLPYVQPQQPILWA